MIPDYELKTILSPLERLYGELEPEVMQVYINTLRARDSYLLSKAVGILIEHHKTTRFPKPGQIMDRYREAAKTMAKAPVEQDCKRCLNMGQWIDPEDDLAKPCPDCEVGKRLKRGRTRHDREFGHLYVRSPKKVEPDVEEI